VNITAKVAHDIIHELRELHPSRRTPPSFEDWMIEGFLKDTIVGLLGSTPEGRPLVARFELTADGERLFYAAVRREVRRLW
jgi:hypothetical protein